jgi:thiamine-phosphate pyrophosphorylase
MIMADAKPSCRLYLQVPAPLTAKLEAQLSQTLANTSAACVLLCNNDQQSDEISDRFLDIIQAANIACLIENDVARAERLGADGVHIPADVELYRHARATLGESANIGVGYGLFKHNAMSLAEMGADYVAFGPEPSANIDAVDQCAELVAWWSEIFVVPCVAWNIDDATQAERLARLGADFVAPSAKIWQDENAATLIAGIDDAIRRARRAA